VNQLTQDSSLRYSAQKLSASLRSMREKQPSCSTYRSQVIGTQAIHAYTALLIFTYLNSQNAGRSSFLRSQERRQNLTALADLHLFVPVFLNHAFTNGAINKPTEPSSLELPGRTLFLAIGRTFFDNPARLSSFMAPTRPGD